MSKHNVKVGDMFNAYIAGIYSVDLAGRSVTGKLVAACPEKCTEASINIVESEDFRYHVDDFDFEVLGL